MEKQNDEILRALDVIYGNFIKEKVHLKDGIYACLEVALLALMLEGVSKKVALEIIGNMFDSIEKAKEFNEKDM